MPPWQMRSSVSSTSGEVALVAGALPGAPEEFEHHRLREFRRPAHAAVDGIDHAGELLRRAVELALADHDLALRPRGLGKPRHQRGAVLLDALGLLAEDARDVAQHVDEGGPAVARWSWGNRCRPRTARRPA